MTQVGEGHEADSRHLMTFGAPAAGEVLADRYRLEEHINDDSAGRAVWRGVDVVLRRPVAVVMRRPGGAAAEEMLSAAVAASRVTHSNLVGVYDAIDEGDRAYVVREWVEGASLRDYVAGTPLDAARATTVGHAVASAVAAVHATGMAHGNIHPGTVLIGDDGRVVLADARADDQATGERDIRAVGAILYFSLTGHWPHRELPTPGRQLTLPDAVRDANGVLAAPRQIRAGVPSYLDELVADLLDRRRALPSAEVLAAELGRLDAAAEVDPDVMYDDTDSPLGFGAVGPGEPPRTGGRKLLVGVAGLLLIAVAGLLIGARVVQSAGSPGGQNGGATSTPPATQQTRGGNPAPVALTASQVRIVDPPRGDRGELRNADRIVDGKDNTGWQTDRYTSGPKFWNKPGMGVLVDLGQRKQVSTVEVRLSAAGASAELRTGDADPGSTSAGDQQVVDTYKIVGEPKTEFNGTTMVFTVEQETQFLLYFITGMPATGDGRWQIGVQEIIVHAR